VTFQAGLQAPAAESQELLIRAGDGVLSERIGSKTKDIFIPLELGPHQSIEIIFEFHGKQVDAPGDPRQLYFAVIKPSTLDRPQ